MDKNTEKKSYKKRNNLVTGMIVGGAVGSVLSVLFASKKNRDKAKKYSQKFYTGGKTLAEKFLNKYKKNKKSTKSKKPKEDE